MNRWAIVASLVLFLRNDASAASLEVLPEFLRSDPFGNVIAIDKTYLASQAKEDDAKKPFTLTGARGGYVSFHLLVKLPQGGNYRLSLNLDDRSGKTRADLFREWFHFTESDDKYYPDALIPVRQPYGSTLPEPDNAIQKQNTQAFWVDLWIPADAAPGVYKCAALLETGKKHVTLPLQLRVLTATVPDADVVVIDHNSYGSSWLADFYKNVEVPGDSSFRLSHAYHRLFYEHRGVFHQLGYGHGGKVGPEFAPRLAGSGRNKHVVDWDLYDRNYGPLFDGAAFVGTRRGARPIPFVYLPINPEWPASFLWWGEPGYEAEFLNVVSEMERHFRQKGWTQTRFEMFFNHKKRYKAFPWDGDEARFPEDDKYFLEYARLLKKAIPPDTPVKFVFRSDSSWAMEHQFKVLAGIVNFWVCGGTLFSWYPDAPRTLKERGDIVWIYGEAPGVTEVSSAITFNPLRVWLYGIDGFVHWLTVSPGKDPWFHFDGGATALAYSGERFGVLGPIPSLRLKLQRNCVQDIALLDSLKSKYPAGHLKSEAARLYNGTKPSDWWNPRPAIADTPPYDWTNSSIEDADPQRIPLWSKLDSGSWQRVRRYVMELAAEAK